jgi:hypothetical protein
MRGEERKQLSEETEFEEDGNEKKEREEEESETVALVAEGMMRTAAPPLIVAIVAVGEGRDGKVCEGVSNTRSAIWFC